LEDCVLRFHLVPGTNVESLPASAWADSPPYHFEMKLGDIEDDPRDASLEAAFASVGVDVQAVKRLVGPDKWGWNWRFTPDLTKALGPLPHGKAIMFGEIEYGQTDAEGQKSRQKHRIRACVGLYTPLILGLVDSSCSYQA